MVNNIKRGPTYYALIGLVTAGPTEALRSRATIGDFLGVTRARAGTLLRQAKEAGLVHQDFLPDKPQMARPHDPETGRVIGGVVLG